MKLRCPKCSAVCGLFERGCQRCGFPLTARSVLRLYVVQARQATALECPRCRKGAVPIGAKVCPACGEIPTFRDLVEATVGPPRRRVRNYCDNAPPHAKRLAQWIYLLLSATLLWWLLGYVQQVTGGHWLGLAALSMLYLTAIGLCAAWWMPRGWLFAIAYHAPGMVKFSLFLNFLASLLVLQLLIRVWWEQAGILAGLFVILLVAARQLTHRVLPVAEALREVYLGPRDGFDNTAPQGRSAKME